MEARGTNLQNITEKTFVFGKRAFAMAVDEKLPKTQNTLLDESIMLKLGIKPSKVMTQRFAYAGITTRIVAEARFTAQTVLNGVPSGTTFLKAFVVRDLSSFYGVDAIAGGKLYTKLTNTDSDDSHTEPAVSLIDAATPSKSTAKKKCKSPAMSPSKSLKQSKSPATVTPEMPTKIFFKSLHPEMYSPSTRGSPASTTSSTSCSFSCSHTKIKARMVPEPFHGDDDDNWDNIGYVLENQFFPRQPDYAIKNIHNAIASDDIPSDFSPCGYNCYYTMCNCVRQYEGRNLDEQKKKQRPV